jgi:hypothetical protein
LLGVGSERNNGKTNDKLRDARKLAQKRRSGHTFGKLIIRLHGMLFDFLFLLQDW